MSEQKAAQPREFRIIVLTRDAKTREIEQRRVIDHNHPKARVWLGKHAHWALRNHKVVETIAERDEQAEC
jgi:hypothetical protein